MIRQVTVGRAWIGVGAVASLIVLASCTGHRAPLHYKTVQWDSYAASSASDRITVAFHSSGARSDNPCYEPRRVTAMEGATTVTVRLEMSGLQGPFSAGDGCTTLAARDTAAMTLREPLGNRRVLDAARPTATPSRG